MLDKLNGRNGTGEFARRSVKNLQFIVAAGQHGEDVHPITQTVGMLLGIIVFPWERSALNAVKKKRLVAAIKEGWPTWEMSGPLTDQNRIKTVGNLIEQIRHAVAHGHVSFDSDSRSPGDVVATFENKGKSGEQLQWCGRIRADKLLSFCTVFADHVADYVA